MHESEGECGLAVFADADGITQPGQPVAQSLGGVIRRVQDSAGQLENASASLTEATRRISESAQAESEMAAAVVSKLPVKVIILNNRFHGMVRQWQDLFYEGRYASSYLDTTPDFVKLAEAYGAVGLRASKVGDLDTVLKEAIATDKPVVVDVPTYPYENCYPMIPAGGCNHEMILEDPPELKRRMAGAPSTGSDEDKDTILTA